MTVSVENIVSEIVLFSYSTLSPMMKEQRSPSCFTPSVTGTGSSGQKCAGLVIEERQPASPFSPDRHSVPYCHRHDTNMTQKSEVSSAIVDKDLAKQALGSYTWQEVAQHYTKESCWVIYNEGVYDITEFLPRHPGGVDLLLLCASRDITNILRPYHWNTDAPVHIIQQFYIGKLSGPSEFPVFPADTGFYREMRSRVADYFITTGQDPKDPRPGLYRLLSMLMIAFLCYFICHVSRAAPFSVRCAAAIIFGVFQSLMLLHAMHDASHSSFSHNPNVWTFVGHFVMDIFAGASLNSWLHQHVISHHVYTNIVTVDSDLPVNLESDLRRITPQQSWSWPYRYQVAYLPVLYSLLGIKFRIQDILGTLVQKTNGAHRVGYLGPSKVLEQIAAKAMFAFWRIAIPVILCRASTTQTLILFFIAELTTGMYLAYNFQVSHISPQAEFPSSEGELDEWAISQVKTSVDYAHGCSLTTYLSGALNYQTVHHLFPAISQYHYPAIGPIVKKVCEEYGVRFNCLSSFSEAFNCHLSHLYSMGNPITSPERVKFH